MAYQLTAEKHGDPEISVLRERLAQLELIEFFSIKVDTDSVNLGISIPFKVADDPALEAELVSLLTFLVEQQFNVTDLISGTALGADDISGIHRKIAGP